MRILVINTTTFRVHGISSVIINYYKAMKKNNSNLKFDFIGSQEIDDRYKKIIDDYSDEYYITKNRRKNLFSYWKLLRDLVKKNDYDVIHIHGNSSLMILDLIPILRVKSKKIVHVHNTQNDFPILNYMLNFLFNLMYDKAVAASKESGEKLFKSQKFEVLKNGIEVEKYKYDQKRRNLERKKIGIPSNAVVFLHVGRFSEQKNHNFLIEIFFEVQKNNPDAHLVLVGNGPKFKEIEEKVGKMGVANVHFLGVTDDIPSLLSMSDAFILPSLYEAFPVIMVEAQANGLPLLVSDNVVKETQISGKVKYISLKDREIWIKSMEKIVVEGVNRVLNNEDIQKIADTGYDIKNNASELLKIYL